jgi:uncharacterized protein (DUF1501 family)
MDRRKFLQVMAASSFAPFMTNYGWAFSNGKDDPSHKKLIVIMLRGAIDGMNVVAPVGDRNYHALRPSIALSSASAINLDGYFALHPSMQPLMPLWQDRSLAFVHACGSPDPTRSHFDAQDYMESGLPGSKAASTGWMNRLVSLLPSKHSPVQAISIGAVLPRIYAGPATVATVGKGNGKAQKMVIDRPGIAQAFTEMYSGANDDIGRAFAEGMSAHKMINADIEQAASDPMAKEQIMANRGAPLPNNFAGFGEQVSSLFRKDPSIQVAFLDFGGWDTHVNQGAGQGQLANRLLPLTNGLAALANGLGPLYNNTSIIVMSEFGRTAHENGNGGTDHGHGNAMWLLGGGVSGGKIYGRWAGLAPSNLHEQRDLPTTTDFRSVIASVLNNQMEVSREAIAKVFPDFQADYASFVS